MGEGKPRAVLEFAWRHMCVTYSLSGEKVWITWTAVAPRASLSNQTPKTSAKLKGSKPDTATSSARPAMYIEDSSTGKWSKISMKDLDFSRVCEDVVAACTEPQITQKNLTQFALPIWIKQGGFQVLALKEIDESELSTTPLGRRRHLEPGNTITPTKPKKARADPEIAELSQDEARAARIIFGDLGRTLTTVELTQIQAAEAMVHKKGWIPPVELLLRARDFAMRECKTPQDSPEYQLWKFARSGSNDKEDAERARKLRRQRTGIMNPPELTWSTMEAVLDFTLERQKQAAASVVAQQEEE